LTSDGGGGIVGRVDPLYVEFGKRVKAARRSAELTQAELAKAIGLTRTSVANIEAGRQRAFLDTVYGIADAVRCAPQELLPDATALRAELPAAVGSQPDDVQQWIRSLVATPRDTQGDPTDAEGRARGTSNT